MTEACGNNNLGQANVPPLPPGRHFTHVAAGADHTVYLTDDGKAIAAGSNAFGETTLPELPEFRKYVAVSCGERHTVLLRDDGVAVAFGRNMFGQCDIPELPQVPGSKRKMKYTAIAAGEKHTVLLRDDGQVFAFGLNDFGQCNVPALPKGRRPPLPPDGWYTAIAAGERHTVFLSEQGVAYSVGRNEDGQCDCTKPVLPFGSKFIAIGAGNNHTVLVLSNGNVKYSGSNSDGQLDIPPLRAIQRYVAVACGYCQTVLLRETIDDYDKVQDRTTIAVGRKNAKYDVIVKELKAGMLCYPWCPAHNPTSDEKPKAPITHSDVKKTGQFGILPPGRALLRVMEPANLPPKEDRAPVPGKKKK
jgi:alpha-tubulin suppressor-like RCC1 family protein